MIDLLISLDLTLQRDLPDLVAGHPVQFPDLIGWALDAPLPEAELVRLLDARGLHITDVASRMVGGDRLVWTVAYVARGASRSAN